MKDKTKFIKDAILVASGLAYYAAGAAYIVSKMTASYSLGLIGL